MGWENIYLDSPRNLGQIQTFITMELSPSINLVKTLPDMYLRSPTVNFDPTKHGHIYPETSSHNAIQ